MKESEAKGLSWPVALLVTGMICAMAFLMARMFATEDTHLLEHATLLPCTSSQSIQVLGKGVIYSDGTSLRALNASGRQIWSYVVGANCGYNVGDGGVAGWSDDLLVALNASSGEVMFSASLAQTVLSATTGAQYTAALVGEESNATMIVTENSGREIDRIALPDIIVLDYGFFNNGNMLWIMSLDTNGTVPMSQVTTYRPGRMQAGSITDSEQVVYEVMFNTPRVSAVGTTYIRVYDYAGTEDAAQRKLIYGWYLMDSAASQDGGMMAFVPMTEIGTRAEINDIRLIQGDTDRTIRMPFTCFDIAVRGSTVYGFSSEYVMIHGLAAGRAETYRLPFACDGLIGVTEGRSVALVSGDSVYLVSLPR
ncbi:MAG: hypothetical protein IKS52_02530 [Clostridia bacterium]|nr:hypothetical protein [Clostridia bacterium]MBR4442133.1 hypothetical protein [Clostridia bacterium]